MANTIEIGLAAANARFDDDDPRWRGQVADLMHELRRGAGSVRARREPVPGTKGAVDQVILALGSAGAFTAAVQIVRAWLARDKHRTVRMTVTGPDGRVRTVQISAENASAETLAPFVAAATSMLVAGPS